MSREMKNHKVWNLTESEGMKKEATEVSLVFAAIVDKLDDLNNLLQELCGEMESILSEDEKPVMALAISPDRLTLSGSIDMFFEKYDWFGESEVCEPVPGVPDVYMTYDRKKLMLQGDNIWLAGDIVVYRVDENNNVVSVNEKDICTVACALDSRIRTLINMETREKRNVFELN